MVTSLTIRKARGQGNAAVSDARGPAAIDAEPHHGRLRYLRLPERSRVTVHGAGGNGVQPAMLRTHVRAWALSAMPGKRRRNSTTADSSPLWSNAARIAAASSSVTMNIRNIWGARHVASKRRMVHGCTMKGCGFLRARRLLPLTCRDRALAAKLHDTRARLAAIAAGVRTFAALEDARTHLIVKDARERRSGTAGTAACDPEWTALQGVATTNADSALAHSRRTAEVLDRITEALERLAASLRDT